MKPDSSPVRRDAVERAHLKDPRDASHVMHRYAPSGDLTSILRRFWVPVWSVAPGQEAPQKVLQHPVCLVVISDQYARFYGVVRGLSTTTLVGQGWAVGLMLAPAAGYLLAGPVDAYTDRWVDLPEVLGAGVEGLVERVRAVMADDPHDGAAHRTAAAAVEGALRRFLPVDAEGELVNAVVADVEDDPDLLRVAQVCDRFGLSERALQRLVRRRLGLTPKWLIQRRRLQEAVERLRDGSTTQAEVAAALGYADQPHLIRDFSRVTGMTPGQFAVLHSH
jgi:AraC-like DNA-binding protein